MRDPRSQAPPGGSREEPGGSVENLGGSGEQLSASREQPGDSPAAPGGSRKKRGDSRKAPGDSRKAPGDSRKAPGGSRKNLCGSGGRAGSSSPAPNLLLVGFERSLRPRPDGRAEPCPDQPSAAARPPRVPPFLDEAVEARLSRARQRLAATTPRAHLLFEAQPIPLEGLLLLLKERLHGALTQAVDPAAEWPRQPRHNPEPQARYPEPQALHHAPQALHPQRQPPWQQSPVLQHLLQALAAEWIASTQLFLERLHRDHLRLAARHGRARLPPLHSISGCASDVHPGGHSVLRLGFADGGTLYYKPRPVTGEWLWQKLLEAIANADPTLRLPAAQVHADPLTGSYGWVDSIAPGEHPLHASIQSAHPASAPAHPSGQPDPQYWHHAGAILCLAQHVSLGDLHLENILVTPAGPAVVDAECLGAPAPATPFEHPRNPAATQFQHAIESLYATGLISRPRQAPDVSGLFGRGDPAGSPAGIPAEASTQPPRLPSWERSTTGTWRLSSRPAELISAPPRPSSALAVLPQLASGYRHAAQVLLGTRKHLLARRSPWRAVLEQTHAPRILLRETLPYALAIGQSLAPPQLGSRSLRRRALLSALAAAPPHRPPSPALLRAEINALLGLHIPRFVLPAGQRTLASSSGRPLAPRFAAATAAHTVTLQLQQLSPERLDQVLLPALLAACLAS